MAAKVVISAGQDHQQIAIDPINQTMFLIDASRPAAGERLTRKLGFADAIEVIAEACLHQLVNAVRLLAVLALPVEVVVPGGSCPGQLINHPITAISQIVIDQPVGEDLATIGLLRRPPRMGRIRWGSRQMHGFQQAVVRLARHHHRPLGMAPGKEGHTRIGITRSSTALKLSRAPEKLTTSMVLSEKLSISITGLSPCLPPSSRCWPQG